METPSVQPCSLIINVIYCLIYAFRDHTITCVLSHTIGRAIHPRHLSKNIQETRATKKLLIFAASNIFDEFHEPSIITYRKKVTKRLVVIFKFDSVNLKKKSIFSFLSNNSAFLVNYFRSS